MAMGTVAVAGAAGFVGRHIVAALLNAGYSVRALVRDAERAREALPTDGRLTLVVGDVLENGKAQELIGGCAACVNAVGILRAEGKSTFKGAHIDAVRTLTKACEEKGVSRFVQISSLGVSELGKAEYQTRQGRGERIVRGSSLAWTILRPSLIHGAESDFIGMLAGLGTGHEAPYIFMPYFTRWQTDKRIPMGGELAIDPVVEPVHVDDVAAAVVASLAKAASIGEVYHLTGAERLSWPQLLEVVRDQTGGNHGIKPWGIPGPVAAVVASAAGMVGLGKFLPFDRGMALMGTQDSVSEKVKVQKHLGMQCRGFTATFAGYAGELAGH